MRILKYFLAVLLVCVSFASHSMTVEVVGSYVYATGPVEDDLRKFETAFEGGAITTVVFANSPGGSLWTGLRVGRLISSKGINTVIAGACVSACSIMFMGGKERRFSDALRANLTYIGIHGAHNKDTKQVNLEVQPQIFAFYKNNMGEKFNSSIMNKALYDMDDAGSLLRVFDPVRSSKIAPYHCISGQTARDKCTKFPDVNASSLGIITHEDLVKVTLPASFETPAMAFGKKLEVTISDIGAYYSDLSARQCISEQCKSTTLSFPETPENRAVAVPLTGPGRGSVFNVDTINAAISRAIYGCNHMPGQPARLCEPEVVNQFDLRPVYAAAKASNTAAFEKISLPETAFFASEDYGGVFTSANSFKTKMINDITPQKIDGIVTLGTKALVQMMLSPAPPLLIDVIAAFDTIPKSVAILNVGFALENTEKDAALEKRISSLLAILAPDKSAAIVFFCIGRNSWLSVNAVLRAKKLGYTNIHWYRGGLESWKAASLPTASVVLRAVAL